MIAAATAVTAALAAGTGAALAASASGNPTAHAKTTAASRKHGGPAATAGHDAMAAAVAQELHLAVARVSAALAPLFAASGAAPDLTILHAAARSLGVSTQQLNTALVHAKQSLAGGN